MRRLPTLALTLGLSALVAVAAVDALRGSGEPPPRAEDRGPVTGDSGQEDEPQRSAIVVEPAAPTASRIEDHAELADRLRRNAVGGTLYLSADGCLEWNVRRLRALRLPELRLSEGPRSRTCSFTVSADGEDAAGEEAVWSPEVPILAAETDADELEVIDVEHARRLRLAGSVPAFKPDGTLTHVRAGKVVEWRADCAGAGVIVSPSISFAPRQIGPNCALTAVARTELERALPSGDRLRSVDALVWADSSRMLAVLRTAEGSWLAAYENGRSLGYANRLVSPSTKPPRADPVGMYVALSPGGYLEVYDRDGLRAWGSSIQAAAYDWSPDGDWLAYAAGGNVFLVRTSDWTTRFSLPVSTEGLAWRQEVRNRPRR